MSEVKREHLAGLELALRDLQGKGVLKEASDVICDLIAQAGAAPEQEAVVWVDDRRQAHPHA